MNFSGWVKIPYPSKFITLEFASFRIFIQKMYKVEIVRSLKEKIVRLKIPKTVSVRPLLIYEEELSSNIQRENYFSHIISFDDLAWQIQPEAGSIARKLESLGGCCHTATYKQSRV
jgi:hypothetical protein